MGILIKPLITEKITAQAETLNRYGFVVDKAANKLQIKTAVEEMYNVEVDGVNTMNFAGKPRSRHSRGGVITGKTSSYKKAIVTLAEGDTIDFYSNI